MPSPGEMVSTVTLRAGEDEDGVSGLHESTSRVLQVLGTLERSQATERAAVAEESGRRVRGDDERAERLTPCCVR